MKIAIRTDASHQIGTGHFMRCFTLAKKIKQYGSEVHFICRNLPEHLLKLLRDYEIPCIFLDKNATNDFAGYLKHSRWLGTSQEIDAAETINKLSHNFWDWMIIDHYAIDMRWESIVRSIVKKIMVIDDLADRNHDCDILLDQNFYEDLESRYYGKVPKNCRLFLGPRYALLRDEFELWRQKKILRTKNIEKILVFFGGVDELNYTGQAIRVLTKLKKSLAIDVVIGERHPMKEHVKKYCRDHKYSCFIETDAMAQLMANADLAIGAGGSTSWERCCLGLPSLIFSLADNQTKIATSLHLINAGIYMGIANKSSILSIEKKVIELLNAPNMCLEISKNASSLVDGLGSSRVCEAIKY